MEVRYRKKVPNIVALFGNRKSDEVFLAIHFVSLNESEKISLLMKSDSSYKFGLYLYFLYFGFTDSWLRKALFKNLSLEA